ncbi:MAG: hypothetical protein KJ645_07675 [Planctomycetes bacterium]|nr:hypothetical protein [Planctomycetota bacterium]
MNAEELLAHTDFVQALAPLAGLKWKTAATAATNTAAAGTSPLLPSTFIPGALLMSLKIKIGLTTLLALGMTIVFWQIVADEPDPAGVPEN